MFSDAILSNNRSEILTRNMINVLSPGGESLERMAYLLAITKIGVTCSQALIYRYVDGYPAPRAYRKAGVQRQNYEKADNRLKEVAWLSAQAEMASTQIK